MTKWEFAFFAFPVMYLGILVFAGVIEIFVKVGNTSPLWFAVPAFFFIQITTKLISIIREYCEFKRSGR